MKHILLPVAAVNIILAELGIEAAFSIGSTWGLAAVFANVWAALYAFGVWVKYDA